MSTSRSTEATAGAQVPPAPVNLLLPAFFEDPYPVYEMLRRTAPVRQVEPGGIWAVTGYDDVARVLSDHRVFSSGAFDLSRRPWLAHDPFANSLVALAPPAHTVQRRLGGLAFQAAFTDGLASLITRHVNELADQLPHSRVDLVQGFAAPLQARVLAELLGEPSLAGRMARWVEALSTGLIAPAGRTGELRATFQEIETTLLDLIEARRRAPGSDLISGMLGARHEGASFSQQEMLSFLGLMVVAGWDTGVQLLTNLLLTWTRHPEAFEPARSQPELIPPLVEEVLRYEPPIHAVDRTTLEAVELGGVSIPARSMVLAFVASANRDERRFATPERFMPERGRGPLLSFGHGAHFCLGAPLARQVSQIAIGVLLRKFRGAAVLEPRLQWRWTLSLRSLGELVVELIPGS